jgi:hypothetical protein
MAPPRAFDYEELRKLALEHPGWSTGELQKGLAGAGVMAKKATIDQVLSRHREEWGVPVRGVVVYEEIAPPPGTLASEHKMHTLVRYLREWAAEGRGNTPDTIKGAEFRATALNWATRMHAAKTLVDLTPTGMPYTRPAGAEELNANGDLISLAAWTIPGWWQRRQDAAGV